MGAPGYPPTRVLDVEGAIPVLQTEAWGAHCVHKAGSPNACPPFPLLLHCPCMVLHAFLEMDKKKKVVGDQSVQWRPKSAAPDLNPRVKGLIWGMVTRLAR